VAVASVDCRSAFAPTRPPHNSRPRDGARPRRGARSRPPRRRRRSPLEPGRAEGRGVAIRARGGGEEPGLKQVSSRHARALSGNPPRRHHHGGGRREPEVPRRPPGPRRRRRPPVPSRGGEDAQAVQIRTCVLASVPASLSSARRRGGKERGFPGRQSAPAPPRAPDRRARSRARRRERRARRRDVRPRPRAARSHPSRASSAPRDASSGAPAAAMGEPRMCAPADAATNDPSRQGSRTLRVPPYIFICLRVPPYI
jgi:hypothetical protein